MTSSTPPDKILRPSDRRRRPLLVVAVLGVGVAVLLALFFLPVRSQSNEIRVANTGASYVNFTVPRPSWVTVHFDHPGSGCMNYGMYSGMEGGMNGGPGMMFDHPCMTGADSYSFGTWGGTFHCWASFGGAHGMMGSATMPVWMNVTSSLL